MTEAWELGIAEAARQLRRRQLGSVELLDSVLARLGETEDYARAWAYVDEHGAREAARRADALASSGAFDGVLHGIPLGVKDVIDVRGLPTEAGSASLKGNLAKADAGVVAQLRGSGAVILGKLETHEFAFGQGTPPSRNPRDPERYAGGSSVGSGVAVAVGSAPGALGTDTGGSIRNPAAVNGLVGLKPSAGVVASTGVLNVSHTLDHVGPIARSVEDCALLLDGMAEAKGLELVGGPLLGRIERLPSSLRLGVDRRIWSDWSVSAEVASAVEDALAVLAGLGLEIVDLSIPELDMALPASLAISLSESVEHHRARLGAAAELYLPATRVMIETGALVSGQEVHLARHAREYLKVFLADAMDRAGVVALVSPTLPTIAPRISSMTSELTAASGEKSLSSALRMLASANLTGMPGLSIPCGLVDGQPVGLHLMGRMFSEANLFAIAHAYECATPWHQDVPMRTLPEVGAATAATR